jgi:hypothetical protein
MTCKKVLRPASRKLQGKPSSQAPSCFPMVEIRHFANSVGDIREPLINFTGVCSQAQAACIPATPLMRE